MILSGSSPRMAIHEIPVAQVVPREGFAREIVGEEVGSFDAGRFETPAELTCKVAVVWKVNDLTLSARFVVHRLQERQQSGLDGEAAREPGFRRLALALALFALVNVQRSTLEIDRLPLEP